MDHLSVNLLQAAFILLTLYLLFGMARSACQGIRPLLNWLLTPDDKGSTGTSISFSSQPQLLVMPQHVETSYVSSEPRDINLWQRLKMENGVEIVGCIKGDITQEELLLSKSFSKNPNFLK
ncbi:unnamed protein product [Protopolystoma xenopodis]|uniref:Uncharacterized protein n=1 Tax=Protopolystoma xenopodis TaxID=117903 RepID=A0A448WVV7_9PLAT|nr:unnamed protein product [Protopolystoma xenopodis]